MSCIISILCLLCQFGYIYFLNRKNFKIALLSKTIASLCFVFLGLKAYLTHETKIVLLYVIGMVFDGLGDILLGLRNIAYKEKMFLFGTYSFMIGHIFYLLALIYQNHSDLLLILVIASIVSSLFFYLVHKYCKLRKSQYYILPIYALMIFGVAVYGTVNYIKSNNCNNLLFMIGAIMFASSDTILSFYNFGKKVWWMHPIYSFLYYAGQLLIAFSLF